MAANRMMITSFLCILLGGVSASLAKPPSEAEIIQALKKPVNLKVLEVSITEFAEEVIQRYKIPVQIENDAIPEEASKVMSGVSCNVKDVPLGQVLRRVLKQHGLDYRISDAIVLIVKEESIRYRTWTDSSGRFTVKAELVSAADGKVTLKRSDGHLVTLPASRLSTTDRKFVESTASDTRKKKASK